MATENRKYPRTRTRFPVRVVLAGDERSLDAFVIDISESGLLLQLLDDGEGKNTLRSPVSLESLLRQEIRVVLVSPLLLPQNAVREARYRVVRCSKAPDGRSLVGVELIRSDMASSRDGRDLINPLHYAMPAGLESEFKRLLEFFGVAFPDASSKVIILSSSHKGSGVSTLSWWLAATLSRIPGKKILFVDAGNNNEIAKSESGVKGLNEILFGQASLDEALVDLGKHAPYIIRSGAEEYFGEVKDSHLESIIGSFRNRYSYTIIDGLPPSESPLVLNMAKYADGVFLVIESGKTDKRSCRDAVDRFKQAGARVLGVLLNQIEISSRRH